MQGDPRRFVRSLKPLDECTPREFERACMEYIFTQPVPVERARLLTSFAPGVGHRRHQALLSRLE